MATPAELRTQTLTVGMALKLADMTIRQAVERAERDAVLMMRETDKTRQAIEDRRSRRRNRNRLLVLVVGITIATAYPAFLTLAGWSFALRWTTVLAFLAEMCETAYAYFRRY